MKNQWHADNAPGEFEVLYAEEVPPGETIAYVIPTTMTLPLACKAGVRHCPSW